MEFRQVLANQLSKLMKLDETIAHAREVAEEQRKACDLAWVWDNPDNIKKCAEEHDQLAEWLEELKFLKQWKSDIMDSFCKYDASSFEELVANIRNKYINDFVTKIKKYMETTEQATYIDEINNGNDNYSAMTIYDYVDELADELKAGETE